MSKHLGFIEALKVFREDLKSDKDFIRYKQRAISFGVATVTSGHYPQYTNNVVFDSPYNTNNYEFEPSQE